MAIALPIAQSRSAKVRNGLRVSIIEGCFALFPGTVTQPMFLTGFVTMLGARAWSIGLLTAIPAFCQASQLLSAVILARWGHRKQLCVWTASLGRYMWLVIAGVPFLPVSPLQKLTLFFALLVLSTVLGQISGIAWNDWMGDLVPAEIRGRYFGLRNAVTALVGMGLLWGASRYLDHLKLLHGSLAWGFAVLFAVGTLGAIGSNISLLVQPDPGETHRAPANPFLLFRHPLTDRRFVRIIGLLVLWTFVVGLVAPFYNAYALLNLRISYSTLGLYTMISASLPIVFMPLWGQIIDRHGSQRALTMAMGAVALTPLLWFTMRPGFIAPIWVDAVLNGVLWSGVGLATSNLLFDLAPRTERASYFGVFNTCMGLATAVSAMMGGALLTVLGTRPFVVGAMHLVALQLLFVAAALGRFGVFLLMRSQGKSVPAPVLTIETWPAKYGGDGSPPWAPPVGDGQDLAGEASKARHAGAIGPQT